MSTPYRVHISEQQFKTLKRCSKKKRGCKIKLNLRAASNQVLNLKPTQIAGIEAAKRLGKPGFTLELTGTQTGGFLPLLVPAALAAAKALGLGAAGFLGTKVAQKIIGKGRKKRRKRKRKTGRGVF